MNKTLVSLSLAAIAFAATGAAQAGDCPRGQIYRVSKHVCVDRGEAAKLGLVRGSAHDADKAKPTPEPAPEAAPAAEPGLADTAPQADPASEEAKPPVHVKRVHAVKMAPARLAPAEPDRSSLFQEQPAPVKAEPASNKPSPFGALEPGGVPMSQAR